MLFKYILKLKHLKNKHTQLSIKRTANVNPILQKIKENNITKEENDITKEENDIKEENNIIKEENNIIKEKKQYY